jgi:hypothetical protein
MSCVRAGDAPVGSGGGGGGGVQRARVLPGSLRIHLDVAPRVTSGGGGGGGGAGGGGGGVGVDFTHELDISEEIFNIAEEAAAADRSYGVHPVTNRRFCVPHVLTGRCRYGKYKSNGGSGKGCFYDHL